MAAVLISWSFFILLTGGVSTRLLSVRIISRDWRRPILLAFAALAAAAWLRGGINLKPLLERVRPWWLPFTLGAAVGGAVFLWIYTAAYREHSAFPADQLMASLVHRDPIRWQRPLDVIRNLGGYETLRTFELVFALGVVGLMPWFCVERRIRWYCAWAVLVSSAILLVPLAFGQFSIWRTFFAPLPGFSVVRDPKRIAYVYELAAILAVALFLARLPRRSMLRIAIGLLVVGLVITERNQTVFEFLRPNESYDRWVAAPIEINPSCRSFFIKPAASEYAHRWRDISTVYSVDAMFVSLKYSLPTLNGYSAWAPDGWGLGNPQADHYADRVREWVSRHKLSGVCEFDVDRRLMTIAPIS
jgi:glycerol uptake facilitator-like aquaporin